MYAFIKICYLKLIAIATFFQSIVLLAIRLFWGWEFFQTGSGKLGNIAPIIEFFQTLEIPFPTVSAYMAATTECVGGFCLLIGFASRLVSIPLMGTMIVAYLTAHIEAVSMIYADPQNFIQQLPFNYLFAALLIFVFGPGAISVDELIKRWQTNKLENG